MKRVLITGGAGKVAEFTARELCQDYEVTLFDRRVPEADNFVRRERLPFVVGDLTNLGDCMCALCHSRAEAVVHLGAIPNNSERRPGQRGTPRPGVPEDATMRINALGTYYMLDAARRIGGIERFVAASTSWVLGYGGRISDRPFTVEYLPIDEEHPLRPEDTYSLSKVLDEEMLKAYARAYGWRTVALRFGWVDGTTAKGIPGGPAWRREPDRLESGRGGRDLPPGQVRRFDLFAYVDARDAARAVRGALEAQELEPFQAFYILSDSLLGENLPQVVADAFPSLNEMAPNLQGSLAIASIEKARRKLGYEPRQTWRNGYDTDPEWMKSE